MEPTIFYYNEEKKGTLTAIQIDEGKPWDQTRVSFHCFPADVHPGIIGKTLAKATQKQIRLSYPHGIYTDVTRYNGHYFHPNDR